MAAKIAERTAHTHSHAVGEEFTTHSNAPVVATAPERVVTPAKLAPRLNAKRPLPTKSLNSAAKAFENFSLSRFPDGSAPANYVPATHAKSPTAVHNAQRKAIAQQVRAVADKAAVNPGMTLAIPTEVMKSLLPSRSGSTVDLHQLLGVLRQHLTGTELYAKGEPTVQRVVQEAQQLAQVQAFINAIKTGGA